MSLIFLVVVVFQVIMVSTFENITLSNFKWFNEPPNWTKSTDGSEWHMTMTTGNQTDFWQETYYNFTHNSGHIFGVEVKSDFTFTACIEADFTTLYDQAGLMIYVDEKQWLKAGIEYNDGRPMIGSVLTNGVSDWGTGMFPGNPRKFYLRLSKVRDVVCVKYSTDNVTWTLLRLSPFRIKEKVFVGPMACTPTREGLHVKFSAMKITEPAEDILHSN